MFSFWILRLNYLNLLFDWISGLFKFELWGYIDFPVKFETSQDIGLIIQIFTYRFSWLSILPNSSACSLFVQYLSLMDQFFGVCVHLGEYYSSNNFTFWEVDSSIFWFRCLVSIFSILIVFQTWTFFVNSLILSIFLTSQTFPYSRILLVFIWLYFV